MSPWRRNELVRTPRLELLEDRRLLANVTVGNLNDVVNGTVTSIAALVGAPGADGISLREAILAANADNTDPADTIGFAPSVTGTIPLTNSGHVGEIVISNNLTINGPGAGALTIRAFAGTAAAGDGARIFNVSDGNFGAAKTVAINGLTLTGGDGGSNPGGAIRSYAEDLTLTACTITGNQITGLGGAVWQFYRNLTVNACTISGNTALNGGGIYSFNATVNVTDSTISGNTSTTTPNNQGGGGISKYGGSLTVTNSTISGNRANNRGGGIYNFSGSLIVRHSTITGNTADLDNNGAGRGGGVYSRNVGTATFNHTIVAGNLRPGLIGDDVNGTVVASSAFNLIGVDTGVTGISTGTNGNQIGTGGSPIDPLLGPLADNVGSMFTHALLAGSPGIDAGDPAFSPPPANDQRGAPFVRVADGDGTAGARIDIGAYERQTLAGSFFIVDTLTDENDGNFSAGDLSLREAIALAFGSVGDETVSFAASLTSGGPATILFTRGELAVRDSLTIAGPGADLLTIDATGNDPTPSTNNGDGSRVFDIGGTSAIEADIRGLTLTGGDIANGGAIRSYSANVNLDACTITGNSAGGFLGSGGGIFNHGGAFTINDSTIHENFASLGGGIGNFGVGVLTINKSTISGNSATLGGGIYNSEHSTVTVNSSSITGNITQDTGGGISNVGTLAVFNSTISGNSADLGGGIDNRGDLTLKHCTITANQADFVPSEGGGVGVRIVGGMVTFDHAIVAGNFNGGVVPADVYIDSGAATARYSLIGDVDLDGDGGFTDSGGNLIGTSSSPVDAVLGPLADNGGPTLTHALLAGSAAIDAGDPAAVGGLGDVPLYDQRGFAFARLVGGRIDMGAFEAGAASADFDGDLDVDGSDFLAWQRGLGASGAAATLANGNADGDGDVDGDDLAAWKSQFGLAQAATAAIQSGALASEDHPSLALPLKGREPEVSMQRAADAVFAGGDFAALFAAPENSVRGKRRLWRR